MGLAVVLVVAGLVASPAEAAEEELLPLILEGSSSGVGWAIVQFEAAGGNYALQARAEKGSSASVAWVMLFDEAPSRATMDLKAFDTAWDPHVRVHARAGDEASITHSQRLGHPLPFGEGGTSGPVSARYEVRGDVGTRTALVAVAGGAGSWSWSLSGEAGTVPLYVDQGDRTFLFSGSHFAGGGLAARGSFHTTGIFGGVEERVSIEALTHLVGAFQVPSALRGIPSGAILMRAESEGHVTGCPCSFQSLIPSQNPLQAPGRHDFVMTSARVETAVPAGTPWLVAADVRPPPWVPPPH